MNDRRLRNHYLFYIIGAVLFTATLSAAVLVHRYCSEMSDTVDRLKTLSGNSVKVKRATQSAYDAMIRIRKEAPVAYLSGPVENMIFQTVDSIKGHTGNAELAVDPLQDGGDEVRLPLTLKGNVDDYGDFLRMLHFLESLRFPFFSPTELIMIQETDKPSAYEIKGSIRTPKNPEPPDRQLESASNIRG